MVASPARRAGFASGLSVPRRLSAARSRCCATATSSASMPSAAPWRSICRPTSSPAARRNGSRRRPSSSPATSGNMPSRSGPRAMARSPIPAPRRRPRAMRISERIAMLLLTLAALALPAGPGLAVDASATGGVAPVNVELPPAAAEAAPKLSAVEAFRTGTQALRSGDTKAGLSSLEYAAANGHPVAQWKLGRMYAEGTGVARDDVRAFEYFRGIANAHAEDNPGTPQARFVANAFVALGSYYLDGIPNALKSDPERAREMFAYAASYFGDADAQYNLGRLYLEGTMVQRDPKLAARWRGRAAQQGTDNAQDPPET